MDNSTVCIEMDYPSKIKITTTTTTSSKTQGIEEKKQ